MRATSAKRAAQQREYDRIRPEWLRGRRCARCGTANNLQVHHRAGRVGRLLLDPSLWLALCAMCHKHVTEHPAESYEKGWSVRRVGRK